MEVPVPRPTKLARNANASTLDRTRVDALPALQLIFRSIEGFVRENSP